MDIPADNPETRTAITRAGAVPATSPEANALLCDVWMDAATGRVVVGGWRTIELHRRPLLARALKVVLAAPADRLDREQLFERIWGLRYRPLSHEPAVFKCVQRLNGVLGHSYRLLDWDHDGHLVLRALHPCLILPEAEGGLSRRQRRLLDAVARRPGRSNRDYRDSVGIGRSVLKEDLGELVRRGLLRRQGRGRAVTYVPAGAGT